MPLTGFFWTQRLIQVIARLFHLPRRDGFWVLDQARQRNVECAFVLLVDQKHLDDRFRALAAGVDDYVVKPFSMAEVDARIRAVLTSTACLPSSSANVSPRA